MTLLKPTLQISRLAVFRHGRTVYDQPFHPGVNIIRGANSTGKSTIADFIFFALGGDVTNWKPEAASCDFIVAEVKVNATAITVRRKISQHRNQPMDIFWGAMEAGLASAAEGWEIYPFRRSAEKQSFSQALFRALGMPEVPSDAASNITMHQLLRLIVVDQMSAPDALFIEEQFDSPFTRKTIYELLVGLFDDTLYADELRLRGAKQKAEETQTRINALLDAMTGVGQEIDPGVLEGQIREKQDQLLRITRHLQEIEEQPAEASPPAADNSVELQKQFEKLRRERSAITDELARVQLEIEDSEQFIAELTQRSKALTESMAVRDILGSLQIQFCPQCLQPLQSEHPGGACRLCGQELPKDEAAGQRLRLQQELAMQIRESSGLLEGKRARRDELQARLPSLRRATQQAEQRLKEALSMVTSQRNREIEELFQKRGSLESEVTYLLKFHNAATAFSGLQTRAAELAAEIRELELRIETKRRTQVQHRALAESHISDNAVTFLRSDLPSEEHFEVAQKVTVDLNLNSFAVDGRNQFSASSVTLLRNAVHFAFLFSSLELDFFRYPRLILCDNIEDKGMVAARSQKFQQLIVERSSRFEVEHQIIFSTSMIAPELNNATYCVGDDYTHENKSLRI